MSLKKKLSSFFKWGLRIYVAIATLVGTVVMVWPFALIAWNGFGAPAPMPIYLENGFQYDHDWGAEYSRKIIRGSNASDSITPDVERIMWNGNTVYGYRLGLAKETYYFICTYGEDCTQSQNYSEGDFKKLLKEKNLPEFYYNKAQTYDQLLQKQSKTGIGKHGG